MLEIIYKICIIVAPVTIILAIAITSANDVSPYYDPRIDNDYD